jgi:hypothetical protein
LSEDVQKALRESTEIQEHAANPAGRHIALAAAIIAVLASLATLVTHNRSIAALTAKNHAILLQTRASDTYNRSEAKDVRAAVLSALVDAGIYRTDEARKRLETYAAEQTTESKTALAAAQETEHASTDEEDRSERLLKAYETCEIATALLDGAIVLVSISALVRTAAFFTAGCIASAGGVLLLTVGFFMGR